MRFCTRRDSVALLERACHLTGAEVPPLRSHRPTVRRGAAVISREMSDGSRGNLDVTHSSSPTHQRIQPLPETRSPREHSPAPTSPLRLRARVQGVWELAKERAKQTTRLVAFTIRHQPKNYPRVGFTSRFPISGGQDSSGPAASKMNAEIVNNQMIDFKTEVVAAVEAAVDVQHQVSTPRYPQQTIQTRHPETPVYPPAPSPGNFTREADSFGATASTQIEFNSTTSMPAYSSQHPVEGNGVHVQWSARNALCPTVSSKAKLQIKTTDRKMKTQWVFQNRGGKGISQNPTATKLPRSNSAWTASVSAPKAASALSSETINAPTTSRTHKAPTPSKVKAEPRNSPSQASSYDGAHEASSAIRASSRPQNKERVSAVRHAAVETDGTSRHFLLPTQASAKRTQLGSEGKRRQTSRRWRIVEGVWRQAQVRAVGSSRTARGLNGKTIKRAHAKAKLGSATATCEGVNEDLLPSSTQHLRKHIQSVRLALAASRSTVGSAAGEQISNGIANFEVHFLPYKAPSIPERTHNDARGKRGDEPLKDVLVTPAVHISHTPRQASTPATRATGIRLPVRTPRSAMDAASISRQMALVATLSAATAFGMAAAAAREAGRCFVHS